MRPICGYRLSNAAIPALGSFFEGFRSDALRILSRNYSIAVADELARRLDLHRAKLAIQDEAANPLRDATNAIRTLVADPQNDLDLDCRVVAHFVNDQVLLRLAAGVKSYRHILEAQPGLTPFHLGREPDPVTPEWQERADAWAAAFPNPRLGMGLTFQLLDGTLPAPRWSSVKRSLPNVEVRVRRTTRAWLWNASAFKADNDLANFRAWLSTQKGKKSYFDAARLIERSLLADPDRDQLTIYGPPPESSRPRARPLSQPAAGTAGPVDHADVMETADGHVFVAIMDANLSPEDRLFLQVAQQTISFVQAGKDFGQVADVPNAAIDLLRGTKQVTVVEIRNVGGRKELKARHVAIIRDASPADDISTSLSRWRRSATKSAGTTPDKKWAEK